MELFEESVLAYIAGPAERFVRPQFSLDYEGVARGSYPDFVALDYKDHVATAMRPPKERQSHAAGECT